VIQWVSCGNRSLTRVPGDGFRNPDIGYVYSGDTGSTGIPDIGFLGFDHPRTRFNDVMLALFEHIAGLETIPTPIARQYLNSLWSMYQQASKANHAG